PLVTLGDAQRLEQVLLNLLGNAHAHTQSGARIDVAGWTTPEEVRLVVTDNGPGIPAEDLEVVFQRFHRHASSEGSGLGLASARALVELHDGRLRAERPPGGGAAFHLALPRPSDPAPPPQPETLEDTRR
ncbi:MAG: ATP-binding protein, partial [Chloroflexota bacterium]|nr:ATP-binding protein [Chloroflexota bacterium]